MVLIYPQIISYIENQYGQEEYLQYLKCIQSFYVTKKVLHLVLLEKYDTTQLISVIKIIY